MKYRRLGATEITVSEIGFGGWGIGGDVNGAVAYGPTDDEESELALKRAFELGITFYDTADFYGFGHSEELIGKALKNARSQVVIATKVGLLDARGTQDFSPLHIRQSAEASLRRLQTDYIDVYQLHNPPLDLLGREGEVLSILQSLKAEGKIRTFGISVRSPDDGFVAVTSLSFKCIQVNFNLVDQRAAENGLFAECEREDVGVIVRTPLCFGFLTGGYSLDSRFDDSDHRAKWSPEQIRRWAEAYQLFPSTGATLEEQTPAHFALRFCLSYRPVSTVIPGMLKREHVEENVAASQLGRLSQAELDRILKIYRENEFFCR
jgi:aryl-alcohol dehydrogenase-like predicted oxidoreductase